MSDNLTVITNDLSAFGTEKGSHPLYIIITIGKKSRV